MLGPVSYAASQAQIRAKRSRLLSDGQWLRLVAAKDEQQFRMLLQATPHADMFAWETAVIEQRLTERLAAETYALKNNLQGRVRELLAWYARRFEVDNLKTILRALHYRQERDEAQSVLLSLKSSPIDWVSLLSVGSVVALIEQLRGTAYAPALDQALERYQQEQQLFYLEVSLDLVYFQRLVRLIESLSSVDRKQAQRFLGFWIDSQNLLWAYRYRVYARLSAEEILNYCLHKAFTVKLASLRRIVTGAPLLEVARHLGLELPPEQPERDALQQLELLSARQLLKEAQTAFKTVPFHVGGVLAYLTLLETEVRDLSTLLEGKRLNMSPDILAAHMIREVRRVHT